MKQQQDFLFRIGPNLASPNHSAEHATQSFVDLKQDQEDLQSHWHNTSGPVWAHSLRSWRTWECSRHSTGIMFGTNIKN